MRLGTSLFAALLLALSTSVHAEGVAATYWSGKTFAPAAGERLAAHAISGEIAQVSGEILVTTLEWPPYTGQDLPQGGAVTEIVRQAFGHAGIHTEVKFLPWKRAIAYADEAKFGAIAFFPGYHCDQKPGFVASWPIGKGPLVLAERVRSEISWESLDELEHLRVGTVIGYANTEEFDRRVEDGRLTVITSITDVENLLKLAVGKLDAAVVDRYVFEHLIRTNPRLARYAKDLRVDERTLEEKSLYLCFRASAQGERLRHVFDEGLQYVDFDAIWHDTLTVLR